MMTASVFTHAQVILNVGDNFQNVIDANPPGTTYLVKNGFHRLQSMQLKDGDTVCGEVLNGQKPIMNGAQVLTGWQMGTDAIGPYWFLNGVIGDNFAFDVGTCLTGYDCHRAEDIYIDCDPLAKVTSFAELDQPNETFIDGSDVYIRTDPTNLTVEASVLKHAIFAESSPTGSGLYAASDVTIKDLIVEKYASPAQHGAIHAGSNNQSKVIEKQGMNWTVINNEVRLNHGAGIFVNSFGTIEGNYVHSNGQIGLRASGTNVTINGNEVTLNGHDGDFSGYHWGWEGGGSKFVCTDSIHIYNNHFHSNYGPGIWTDIDNINSLIEYNLVEDNSGPGIFHEISYDAVIRCNTAINNWNENSGGNYYGANIFISNSSNVEVYNNTTVSSGLLRGNGIIVNCADRVKDGVTYYTNNNHVHDNCIYYLDAANYSGLLLNNACSGQMDNLFENNMYHSVSQTFNHFNWGLPNTNGTISWMQAIPQDLGSTMDSEVTGYNTDAGCCMAACGLISDNCFLITVIRN